VIEMQKPTNAIAGRIGGVHRYSKREPVGRDRYAVALDAALMILEEIDTLPDSTMPVRLAKVTFIVLDAIYDAERHLGVEHDF
jgi:hypothetical protein